MALQADLSVKTDTCIDGQMLGKAVVQNFCTLPSNNQHSSQIVECFPSAEPVSLSEFLDDQSDDGYATSPASSTSPGSMWSVETTPSTVDEDTISSITSFWDEMSNDSTMFKPSLKRSADSSAHGTARKCLKLVEGPQHAEVPKQAADFSSALKHSQLLLHLAGTSTDDPIISLQESSKCPVQSNIKSSKTSCRKVTRPKSRKLPGLSVPCPPSQDGIELTIVDQPERHHRARYLVEGSRGCVKNEAKVGFPTVQLKGWNQAAELMVFIVTDQGKVRPHGYYQACKVTGQNATPCSEVDMEGTKVIRIPWQPQEHGGVMEMRIDCVGILKLRNADVEHNGGLYRSKKKSTSVRMAFRVLLPGSKGVTAIQTISSLVCCTQPLGHPEIIKRSLTECSAAGGQELFIIGKNFINKNCEVKLLELSGAGKSTWVGSCKIDKSLFHNTHILCTIPPYKVMDIQRPVEVYLVVSCGGGKSSELMAHPITYIPIPEPKTEIEPVQEPVPDLSNAAVLQLLASRLSCTKDSSPPILKLSDQIPLISMGQPLDLKRNSVDLVNQQTQMLQQQIIQQTQKQSFEDLMKVAAGLMTKSDIVPDVEPMQVVSPAIDLNASLPPSTALLSSVPVVHQQKPTQNLLQGLSDLLVTSSSPNVLSAPASNVLSAQPGFINLTEPTLFSSTVADNIKPAASTLSTSAPSVINSSLVDIFGSASNFTLNNPTMISDVKPENSAGLLTGAALEDVLDFMRALQQKPTSILM
ncbi:uncharacterized protein [Apostichopus japonicus]|uniref:uncharacterized protein isoform X1 n=1 Tax=Stichopus japonicus TaxID=307972 RepID=UPI003AB12D06